MPLPSPSARAGDIKKFRSLGQEDPLEEGMATHSSILAWRIPWAEEPGGLHSLVSQRVRHDRSYFSIARGHADVKNVFHIIVQRVKI